MTGKAWNRWIHRGWWIIAVWPIAATVLTITAFSYLERKQVNERAIVEQVARKETESLAAAYSVQLAHTVEQIDQNLLNIKYFYENVPGSVDLQKQVKKGLYPMAGQFYVSILDASGTLTGSTVPGTIGTNLASDEFFQIHGLNRNLGLSITKHNEAPGVPFPVIRFSRGLETLQGTFAGVVSIAVQPRLLGSFYDQTALGRGDFVTVRSTTGKILTTRMGEKIQSYSGIFRKPPVFDRPIGVTHYPPSQFNDNEARLYAWNTLTKYPLISTVGLLEADIYGDFAKKVAEEKRLAAVALVGMSLLTFLGMVFTYLYLRRRRESEAVQHSYHLAIEGGREGFFSLRAIRDARGEPCDFFVDECNERGAALLGLRRTDVAGSKVSGFYKHQDRKTAINLFAYAMQKGFYEDAFSILDNLGQRRWLNRRLVKTESGLAVTLRDVSDAKRYEASLHQAANCDALTGLYNRHWLMEFFPDAFERMARHGQQMALLFVDLDNFKAVNNTLGHSVGDQLLVLAAKRFRSLVRPDDPVVRLGGDEFTILLENVSRSEIVEVVDRIIKGFMDPFDVGQSRIDTVRASIGIAVYPDDGTSPDALMQHADTAMYRVKEAGKAHYCFYSSEN